MTNAEKVIGTAKQFLGTKESPANSNNVIFNRDYYGRTVKGSAYPWCCVFVWDIFRLADMSDLFCGGEKVAYCPTVENFYKKKSQYFQEGKRGDLVLMDFGKGRASHIGILLEKDGSDYVTIEGNTSVSSNDNGGAVMIRRRKKNVIRGFARPAYTTEKDEYYPACKSNEKSLVDGLKSVKVGSSLTERFEIAKKNGIEDYKGTAKQNEKLLELLKNGKLKKYY